MVDIVETIPVTDLPMLLCDLVDEKGEIVGKTIYPFTLTMRDGTLMIVPANAAEKIRFVAEARIVVKTMNVHFGHNVIRTVAMARRLDKGDTLEVKVEIAL